MQASIAFLLGLLADKDPVVVTGEDFEGEHGSALQLWQRQGFVATEPAWNSHPSCPYCQEGRPHLVGNHFRCAACHSVVDRRYLLLWRLDLGAFLRWLTHSLMLRGEVNQLDEQLWQLGTLRSGTTPLECFFCRRGVPGEQARQRLLAYRNALVFRPLPTQSEITGFQGLQRYLLELLSLDRDLLVLAEGTLLQNGRHVRVDKANGAVWAGSELLGEVAPGSKEYALLILLWRRLDEYVAYSDLKKFVLQATGSADSADEATFCQRLKSRIKKSIPAIDRLITTTNKADGYRLRRVIGDR